MRKTNFGLYFILLLYCINIFLIFLASYAISKYEGPNVASIYCIIDFKVGFLGNWLEHRIFPGYSEGSFAGVSEDIGNYINLIIKFLVPSLIFIFIGTSLSGLKAKEKINISDRKQIRVFIIVKSIGSISSILGGILGILSLVMFSIFKTTIIQPYNAIDGFPPNNIPQIRFAPGFYLSSIIYIIFVIFGMITIIRSFIFFRQIKKTRGISVLSEMSYQ